MRTISGVVILLVAVVYSGDAAEPLQFEKAIPLSGVDGRIDHMAADVNGGRLFVAALGNKTLEIIDWNSGKRIKSISGLDEPQGIVYRTDTNRLYVATGGDGSVRTYDGSSFALLQTLKLGDDADNLRFDAAAKLVWAGYGSGALTGIDGDGKRVADIPVSAHPESFQLEKNGSRIFLNVPRSRKIEVIDREKKAVVAGWGMGLEVSNFPMALDEKSKRLFVICRTPARLIVFDTDTGKIVAKRSTVGDSDDLFFDAARHRIYATGGEGAIVIYEQKGANEYNQIARISTAAGARTSLFVPEAGRLFVAVPHRGAQAAEIRVFKAPEVGR
jgi:DNA-binding beta-propeller fold protein YncE